MAMLISSLASESIHDVSHISGGRGPSSLIALQIIFGLCVRLRIMEGTVVKVYKVHNLTKYTSRAHNIRETDCSEEISGHIVRRQIWHRRYMSNFCSHTAKYYSSICNSTSPNQRRHCFPLIANTSIPARIWTLRYGPVKFPATGYALYFRLILSAVCRWSNLWWGWYRIRLISIQLRLELKFVLLRCLLWLSFKRRGGWSSRRTVT